MKIPRIQHNCSDCTDRQCEDCQLREAYHNFVQNWMDGKCGIFERYFWEQYFLERGIRHSTFFILGYISRAIISKFIK